MVQWSLEMLREVLDAAPEGIVLCEVRPPDCPLVYANPAFARLSGYDIQELIGQDLRRLQAWDREQAGRAQLREAIARSEGCRALMRNYRKDGSAYWNEVLVRPLRGRDGVVTHFVGYHREVGAREPWDAAPTKDLPSWQRGDRLSGLCSRAYFEELLRRDWQIAQREGRTLTLIAFDIDELGSYNDTFGRAAGDACIRRVCGVLGACFKRGSDLVARWEGGCVLALVRNADTAALPGFADAAARKVLGQHIHHPRASRQKVVSVSVGAASLAPAAGRTAQQLVQATLQALRRAKSQQAESRVAVAGPQEMP